MPCCTRLGLHKMLQKALCPTAGKAPANDRARRIALYANYDKPCSRFSAGTKASAAMSVAQQLNKRSGTRVRYSVA